jgi:diacylglycerol kinase family enzyme
MKSVQLIHNPTAGEGEDITQHLIQSITDAGYDCSYSSTKEEDWEKLDSKKINFLVVAGGDGTIRKTALNFLERQLPIALIPMGTANNIAKTLDMDIEQEVPDIIRDWNVHKLKPYDVGRIYNLKQEKFFIEGLGFGLFPRLIKEMRKQRKNKDISDKSMKTAWELLHDIVLTYEARSCAIEIDDAEFSGKFLMAEIMNTRSIGPNLNLVPFSDPGDGEFEVVLITEAQREQFAAYILSKIMGKEEPSFFNILKAKKLKITWEGVHLHVDDEYIKLDKAQEIKIELQPAGLQFITSNAAVENQVSEQ